MMQYITGSLLPKQPKNAYLNIDVCETLMPPFPNMTFDLLT